MKALLFGLVCCMGENKKLVRKNKKVMLGCWGALAVSLVCHRNCGQGLLLQHIELLWWFCFFSDFSLSFAKEEGLPAVYSRESGEQCPAVFFPSFSGHKEFPYYL